MKKCPPGVICIENVSLFFIFVCIVIIGILIYISLYKQNVVVNNNNPSEKIIIKDSQRVKGSWSYNNFSNDVLLNPYAPPLRDERYLIPSVPINISTNVGAVDTNYRQVGILTATNTKGKILPLMGRPIFTNRDKWQYYTMSDQHNSIKLPLSRNGKSCTNEYGCDRLYNSDTVYIEGVNEAYRVTMYDNDTIRYLPI
jgi:hypothetical protein